MSPLLEDKPLFSRTDSTIGNQIHEKSFVYGPIPEKLSSRWRSTFCGVGVCVLG